LSANDRQNFFETPSTRTRTSSSEGEVEGPESSVECVLEGIEGVESGGRGSPGLEEDADSRVEGVLGAGRWSLDARDHLALRSQGLGEAGCAAEGF